MIIKPAAVLRAAGAGIVQAAEGGDALPGSRSEGKQAGGVVREGGCRTLKGQEGDHPSHQVLIALGDCKGWGRGRGIALYGLLGFHTNSMGVAMGTLTSLALQVGAQDQGVSFTQNLVRKANLSPTPDLLSQRPSVGLRSLLCAQVP